MCLQASGLRSCSADPDEPSSMDVFSLMAVDVDGQKSALRVPKAKDATVKKGEGDDTGKANAPGDAPCWRGAGLNYWGRC